MNNYLKHIVICVRLKYLILTHADFDDFVCMFKSKMFPQFSVVNLFFFVFPFFFFFAEVGIQMTFLSEKQRKKFFF